MFVLPYCILHTSTQACKVCDDDGSNCETIGQDGAGVENADFVLYVSADLTFAQCGGGALAFAVPCQLERQFDRSAALISIYVSCVLVEGLIKGKTMRM